MSAVSIKKLYMAEEVNNRLADLLDDTARVLLLTDCSSLDQLGEVYTRLKEAQFAAHQAPSLIVENVLQRTLSCLRSPKVLESAKIEKILSLGILSAQRILSEPVLLREKWSREFQEKLQGVLDDAVASSSLNFSESQLKRLPDFIFNSQQSLDAIENQIALLENVPGNAEGVEALCRAFHSIKEESGFLSLPAIGLIAAGAENGLAQVSTGRIIFDGEIARCLLHVVEVIRRILADISENPHKAMAGDVASSQEYLRHVFQIKAGRDPDRVGVGRPPLTPPLAGSKIILTTAEKEKKVPRFLGEILIEQETLTPAELNEALSQQGDIPTSARRLGEILLENQAISKKDLQRALAIQNGAVQEDALKISRQKLDALTEIVGELATRVTQVTRFPLLAEIREQKFSQDLARLGQVTRQLQSLSISLRLVPIRKVFQKITRLVRDLAKKNNKECVTFIQGEDLEIDQRLLEYILDPLAQIVGQAVTSSLESREERLAKNKVAYGRIELRAYIQSGDVVVEIRDDGVGLLTEAMVPPSGESAQREEKASSDFAYAGEIEFRKSPANGQEDIRRQVDKMGGRVEWSTIFGEGTTVIMRLPRYLAQSSGG